jgi:hypothetical protein
MTAKCTLIHKKSIKVRSPSQEGLPRHRSIEGGVRRGFGKLNNADPIAIAPRDLDSAIDAAVGGTRISSSPASESARSVEARASTFSSLCAGTMTLNAGTNLGTLSPVSSSIFVYFIASGLTAIPCQQTSLVALPNNSTTILAKFSGRSTRYARSRRVNCSPCPIWLLMRREHGGMRPVSFLLHRASQSRPGPSRTNPWHDGLCRRIRAKWQRFRAGSEPGKRNFQIH